MPELTDSEREQMAQLYSLLKFHYYQGTAYQVQELVRNDPAYELWQEDGMATQRVNISGIFWKMVREIIIVWRLTRPCWLIFPDEGKTMFFSRL